MATDKQSKANLLRAALKAAGYNARRVSVRHDHYSMGSSIYVTIRDAAVSLAAVEAIAAPFERIDRCSYSGEILSGGNTYMRVEYDRAITDALAAEILAVLNATAPGVTVELAPGVTAAHSLQGSRFNSEGVIFLGGNGGRQVHCYDTASVAARGAREVLEARARSGPHCDAADKAKRAARAAFLVEHGRYPTNDEMAQIHDAALIAGGFLPAPAAAAPAPEPTTHLAMLAAMGVEA